MFYITGYQLVLIRIPLNNFLFYFAKLSSSYWIFVIILALLLILSEDNWTVSSRI